MTAPIRQIGAWKHFLVWKHEMLAEYRQALTHSTELPVRTHHGVVGEAAARHWLERFLPRRYGVTSGYIRSQRIRSAVDFAHFDVIVFDQLESPILWTESNPDRSATGLSRIIPAEYVRAVLELKSTFRKKTVEDAIQKLGQLSPLMAGVDEPDEAYPGYLPTRTVLGMVFFELRRSNDADFDAITALRPAWRLQRFVYPPMILAGEGRSEDDTALIAPTIAESPYPEIVTEGNLLGNFYLSATAQEDGGQVGLMLDWFPINFARFSFDLLAIMNGSYRKDRMSSFHGLNVELGSERGSG